MREQQCSLSPITLHASRQTCFSIQTSSLQLDRLTLTSRRIQRGQIQGERRSPQRGASVEFADFRTYSHGDDFRQIDWNAYARLEKLFIKLFVAEEDLTVHFLLDTSQSMASGVPDKLDLYAAAGGGVRLHRIDRIRSHCCHNFEQ